MKNWLGFQKQRSDEAFTLRPRQIVSELEPTKPPVVDKLTELAGCQLKYAIFFSILSPFIGYSYTGRFKALGVFLAATVAALVAIAYSVPAPAIRSNRVKIPIGLSIIAIAAADNSRAILSARRTVRRNLTAGRRADE